MRFQDVAAEILVRCKLRERGNEDRFVGQLRVQGRAR